MIDILAQAPTAAYVIPGIGFAAIIGVYIIVGRQSKDVNKQISTHVTDTKIHPEKKDVVYKDVCQIQHRLENKRADERHEELLAAIAEVSKAVSEK